METENRNNKGNNNMKTIKNILDNPLNWVSILFILSQLTRLI